MLEGAYRCRAAEILCASARLCRKILHGFAASTHPHDPGWILRGLSAFQISLDVALFGPEASYATGSPTFSPPRTAMSFRLPIRIGIGILSRPFPFHSMGLCHSRPLTTSTKAIQWTPRFPPINALRLRSSPSLILHFLQTTHRPSPISLLPRTFSTSSRNSVRHTSFPNSSGGRGNPGPRPKYWRHWIFWKTLIDANPPMFIVNPGPLYRGHC